RIQNSDGENFLFYTLTDALGHPIICALPKVTFVSF
ncbi:MAG: hypothetical protein ACI9KM_001147, partial [Rubritalea sp.]